MSTTRETAEQQRRRTNSPPKKLDEARWENEGGRPSPTRDDALGAAPRKTPAVDELADDLMTQASPEGRPPPASLRRREWRWVATLFVILFAPTALAAIYFVKPATVLAALAIVALMALAAAPVWGAALLRGREHRRAKREAEAHVTVVQTSTQSAASSGAEVVVVDPHALEPPTPEASRGADGVR